MSTITLSRGMSDEERKALIQKVFVRTIYEDSADLKVFTKIWNDAQDKLQAKWKADSESLKEEYHDYKITISNKK